MRVVLLVVANSSVMASCGDNLICGSIIKIRNFFVNKINNDVYIFNNVLGILRELLKCSSIMCIPYCLCAVCLIWYSTRNA